MAESAQYMVPPTGSRLVWVLSRGEKTFTQEFKGRIVSIPPYEKREVLMPILEAASFRKLPAPLCELDNSGNSINMGKPIYILELTKEEKAKFDPRSLSKEEISEVEKIIAAQQVSKSKDKGAALAKDE